ncbi:hypothetical protein NL30_34770 [Burkholderia contaminans]|nr:hypothetical protein NL30_34770 [Burkholderia contaminans]
MRRRPRTTTSAISGTTPPHSGLWRIVIDTASATTVTASSTIDSERARAWSTNVPSRKPPSDHAVCTMPTTSTQTSIAAGPSSSPHKRLPVGDTSASNAPITRNRSTPSAMLLRSARRSSHAPCTSASTPPIRNAWVQRTSGCSGPSRP